MVVKLGVKYWARGMSSMLARAISWGTAKPISRKRFIAPAATSSLHVKMAEGGFSSAIKVQTLL
jgi:hypothetical protein